MNRTSRPSGSLFIAAALVMVISAARADCPNQALDPRYKLSRTGDMVVDTLTGVIFMRCTYGQLWSAEARQYTGIPHRTTGDELLTVLADARTHGWQLPTHQQLGATRNSACEIPQVDGAAFPLTPPGSFWTQEALNLRLRVSPPILPEPDSNAMSKPDFLGLLQAAVDFSGGLSKEIMMTPGTGLYVRLVFIPGSPAALAAGIKDRWNQQGAPQTQPHQ